MPNHGLDEIDRRIVDALQRDGRLTNVDLADRVGLSPSPCLRRVRQLEEAGVITGYRASLDRGALGLGLTCFVNVKVERHDEVNATAFRDALVTIPEIIAAHLVSGEADFLLQVVLPDLAAYEAFLTQTLLRLPGVKDIRSNFAIQTVKGEGLLPLHAVPVRPRSG